jgi:hypothetical protein
MVRKQQQQMAQRPRSAKSSHTGVEKMRMSNERTRKDIKRILAERAERTQTGKPHHEPPPTYRR